MNESHGALDRLEARLERLTARVDELTRIVEQRGTARPVEPPRPAAHELARRRRRRHVGHASRL